VNQTPTHKTNQRYTNGSGSRSGLGFGLEVRVRVRLGLELGLGLDKPQHRDKRLGLGDATQKRTIKNREAKKKKSQ
jgi:hypothetical protein